MTSEPFVILVVEDQFLVLLAIAGELEDAGFTVHKAADADQAIAVLEEHPEIELIFTDINMPGTMDGLKLATTVRRRWPKVGIVVTSGDVQPRVRELPADGVFVSKPYNAHRTIGVLRDMASEQRSWA